MGKILKRKHKLVKKKKKRKLGPDCKIYPKVPTSLGRYFDILNSFMERDESFWFRGNANIKHRLKPSALRYTAPHERNNALSLLSDFKRFGEIKLKTPPRPDEEFKWVQLARHHGLPTRLLDWTRNAAIALYFACEKDFDKVGAVFVLNPKALNREAYPQKARIFDPHQDARLIKKYLMLDGRRDPEGLKTIAINPPWNSERIMLQQGVFTLHGSRHFVLTDKQASSLVCVKIRKEYKQILLEELERSGVNEMSIFPEVEHMCNYLKWREKLNYRKD